jgi:hypothetical protein
MNEYINMRGEGKMKKFIFEDCNGNVGQEKIFDCEEKR